MPINDKLARQVLEKLREKDAVIADRDAIIADLQKRLGITPDLGSKIQETLEHPSPGQPRNRIVSDIVRDGMFRGEKPVSKATRRQTEAERKQQLRRELEKARGIRPFRKD